MSRSGSPWARAPRESRGRAGWAALAIAGSTLACGTAMAHAGRAYFAARPAVAPLSASPGPQARAVTGRAAAVRRAEAGLARIGALFGPDGHDCTASVVGADLLVTAAHCDPAGKDFVPGYHEGHSPYGVWKVGRVYVSPRWSDDRDEDHDVAFAQVRPQGGAHLGDVVGYNVVRFDPGFGIPVTVTGYPEGISHAVSGTAPSGRYGAHQMRVRIRGLADGTSGAPWIDPDGEVIGVIGGHEEGGDDDVSYSVCFGDAVRYLYEQARDE